MAQILGQPCEFQVGAAAAPAHARSAYTEIGPGLIQYPAVRIHGGAPLAPTQSAIYVQYEKIGAPPGSRPEGASRRAAAARLWPSTTRLCSKVESDRLKR